MNKMSPHKKRMKPTIANTDDKIIILNCWEELFAASVGEVVGEGVGEGVGIGVGAGVGVGVGEGQAEYEKFGL